MNKRTLSAVCIAVVAVGILAGQETLQAQKLRGKTRPAPTRQLMKGILQPNAGGLGAALKDAGPADEKAWEAAQNGSGCFERSGLHAVGIILEGVNMESASTSTKKRPGWVWAIAIWFFASAAMTLASFYFIKTGAVHINESQRAYFDSLNTFDYATTILLAALNMLGAVFLFLLRKQALYLFCGALILNVILTMWHAATKGWVALIGGSGLVGSILGFGLLCAVCIYSWRLTRTQVLV